MKLNKKQKDFYKAIGKMVLIIALCVIGMLLMTGCGNRQLIDTTYRFDRAIITLPNGEVVDGKVQSWKDYEYGDQIQVKIDGKTYLVHSEDIVLIAGED